MVRRSARLRSVAVVAAATGLLLASAVPQAAQAGETVAPAADVSAAATCTPPKIPAMSSPYPRLYRPTTKYGDADNGVKDIRHVREAQYRLKWLGYYKGSISGYYGVAVRSAVQAFQKKHCMRAHGSLDRATWAHLITRSTKNLSKVPKVCRGSGWHSCYDRSTHQDFLFRDGQLWNVWLVRGGSRAEPTRTGTYKVFARYEYKISTLYNVPMWYFQKHSGGQGQHGSGFMLDPFVGHSHGCINMYIPDAKVLWAYTRGKPLTVTVYGAWS